MAPLPRTPQLTSRCTYTVKAKNQQRNVTVTGANATRDITKIEVAGDNSGERGAESERERLLELSRAERTAHVR
jgi:hypothetical protein